MNQYSRWALAEGIQQGEPIALMMGNRPEYFVIWLGLIQVGAIVALFGSDLRAPAIAHALKVAGARRIIASAECADVCRSAVAALGATVEIWIHGSGQRETRSIDFAVAGESGDALARGELRPVTLNDRALRIFTSGTTGLPKAAEVSHRRLVTWIHWFAGLAGLTASDRLYNCLPMHHSVGGVVAVGAPLVFGGSVAIAERFSARNFWPDVVRWECTAFQYIGELCRYLIAAPVGPAERSHHARIAIGNGLSREVWQPFLDRFGPLRILEFYASTEGNVWLYNVEGKIGSIGRVPPYLALRDPIALVRFDHDSQMPFRNASGFCERCADSEVGEALGRIGKDPGARFEGYSEDIETERKLCATCSRSATDGCGQATSCGATRMASIHSSIVSATHFVGRARTFRLSKSCPFSAPVRASKTWSSMGSLSLAPMGALEWRCSRSTGNLTLMDSPRGWKYCPNTPDRSSCASPPRSRPRRPSNRSEKPMSIRVLTPNTSTNRFTCSMASENCMWRSMRNGTPQSKTAT